MMIFLRTRLRILKPNQSLLPTRRRFGFSSSSLLSSDSVVDQTFVKQIRYLLQINHEPLVKIQKSNIPGAGTGVFYYNNSSNNKEHQHYYPQQQVVCLYPGIYTPGMPTIAGYYDDGDDENLEFIKDQYYIANKILPPSGISFEDNAYIISLAFGQGYIDGCALEVDNTENETAGRSSSRRRRLLNENPSACGHLLNHCSATNSNVQLISFFWDEIIDYYCCSNSHYFQLPNTIRKDGMEWYYDPITKDFVRFPTTHHIDDSHASSSPKMRLRGVAMALNKPVKSGEELFLDYGLIGPPYPNWARDWYK